MVPAYDSGTAVESAPAASSLLRSWLLVPQADDNDDADYAGNDDAEWANSPPSEGGGKAPEAPHAAPAAACPPPPPRKERGPQRPLPPHLALRLRTTTEYLARLSLRRQPPASPPADAPRGKVRLPSDPRPSPPTPDPPLRPPAPSLRPCLPDSDPRPSPPTPSPVPETPPPGL
uniref:RL1 n=1 Tax=Human herpesvirus 2 TaxID=10310 RepID=A0A481TWJ6_HHV2|nr:RL1 [Human alphaherpesvirus 2]